MTDPLKNPDYLSVLKYLRWSGPEIDKLRQENAELKKKIEKLTAEYARTATTTTTAGR